MVASATGENAPPNVIQTAPLSQQISQQHQHQQQKPQEQEQEQEQTRQPQQQLHLQRRVDTTTSNGATGKGVTPSIFEPYADAEVWEGQANPLRIQLDPQTFVPAGTRASTSDSSAGSVTYYVRTDTSTTLPSWLKFDTSTLEFSGAPPVGTYKKTTILTITVAASTVPGYIQATDRFTIKVHVHSLALSTFPLRSCSSSSLYYSQEWDRFWQSYLPDLTLDPHQRHVNFQLETELFRVDGCSQPARSAAAAALVLNISPLGHNGMNSNNDSSSKNSRQVRYQMPYIARINVSLSTETTQALSLFNNTLPSWLSFDHANWTLTGDIPQGAPTRMILDVEAADSFNTTAIFKLQIFSNTTPFSFIHPVPDVWVKRGVVFNVNLLPASLLSYPIEATVLPVEHKFLFEPIDINPSSQSPVTSSSSSNTMPTRLGKNPTNPLLNTTYSHSSGCTYANFWGQQSENNREAGPSPLVPNWFNRTSFTSTLPAPSSPPSEEGKIEFQGHIPCDLILRVRWIARNSLGQLASTEFMIWANDQGPPSVVKPHIDDPNSQHDGNVGPIGVKIAVGIAVATPVLIAIWFMVTRYCRPGQSGSVKPSTDLEGGRIRPLSGGDDNSGNGLGSLRSQRRRQPASDFLPNGEPEYRSSYEDDPSGDEGEGSGSSKRTSILGWIFGERNPAD
ncbi:hypothetical protein BGX29_004820 [Mortierella sp. GBA35]|nr:hypothetical protein BGX29_004820 [Mortierella sp. GBA35]